jgi:hypothetical protein
MHRHRRRGSLARAIRNFADSEIPLPRRIVVASRNLWIRVALRQACCGHDGEPGC